MKHKLSGFLAGVLSTVLIGTLTITALAASGKFTIDVYPINIQVNGETFQPKDAKGNDVPVFTYNGSTYAPLRALAEAYGLEVGYDAEKNMATVNDPNANNISSPATPTSSEQINITHIKVGDKFYQYSQNSHDSDGMQLRLPMTIIGESSDLYFSLSANKGYTNTVSLLGLTNDSVVLPSDNPYIDGFYCCRAIYSDKFEGLSWTTEKTYSSATNSSEVTTLNYNGRSFSSDQFRQATAIDTITIDGIYFVNGLANANDFLSYMGIKASVSYEYINGIHTMIINK